MAVMFTTEPVAREDDDRTLMVIRKCDLCAKNISVFVVPEHWVEFISGGGFIQELFPYLTADERELLLNGFCGPCFDSFCPPDDE
jgi:hypothetical protein